MGINVAQANSQASSISGYAATLRDIANGLNDYRSSLNSAWQADEMVFINSAIERIVRELQQSASDLNSIGSDISSTAAEIRREEEAREAAERAAREQAAREAAAREAAMREAASKSK